jgi:hypothetical protein
MCVQYKNLNDKLKEKIERFTDSNKKFLNRLSENLKKKKGKEHVYNNMIALFCMFIIFSLILSVSLLLFGIKNTDGCNIIYVFLCILHENIWMVMLASIVEVYFFAFIVSKYIPFKPTYVKDLSISKMKEHLK